MAYNSNYPYSPITQKILDYLPSWMAMRSQRDSEGNNDSLSAQFLNTFGIEFEQLEDFLTSMLNNVYLDTADTNLVDYLYKFSIQDIVSSATQNLSFEYRLLAIVDPLTGENIAEEQKPLQVANSFEEFYLSSDLMCLVDYDSKMCYVRRPINNREFEYIYACSYDINGDGGGVYFDSFAIHHIWNVFDEIGLLLGLPRLFKETNGEYRERLLNVFKNPGGPTKLGLRNGIANLLGLGIGDVQIYEMRNSAFRDSLLNSDGSAGPKLQKYARIINEQMANTWDNMQWDRAYWRSLESTKLGYEYLPHVWDASTSGWAESDIQNGIGSGLDLFVKAPKQEENEQEVTYYIGAHALVRTEDKVYPEHKFSYRVLAKSTKTDITTKIERYKYTVVAAEKFTVSNVSVNAKSEYYPTYTVEWDTGTISTANEDPQLEIVSGNKCLSPSGPSNNPNEYIKIVATLDRNQPQGIEAQTPDFTSISITWKDQSNNTQTTVINTDDFDKNDDLEGSSSYPRIKKLTDESFSVINLSDTIQLTYGDFQQVIDSNNDWSQGTMTNCVISNGSLKLRF